MSTAADATKPLPETVRFVVGGPAAGESVMAGCAKHTPPNNTTPRNVPVIRPADLKLVVIVDLLLLFGFGCAILGIPTPVIRKAAEDFTISEKIVPVWRVALAPYGSPLPISRSMVSASSFAWRCVASTLALCTVPQRDTARPADSRACLLSPAARETEASTK